MRIRIDFDTSWTSDRAHLRTVARFMRDLTEETPTAPVPPYPREALDLNTGLPLTNLPPAPPAPPAPLPVPTITAPDLEKRLADIVQGRDVFGQLVRDWCNNFEVDGAPQPDRVGRLLSVFTGYGRVTSGYIREKGGLASAVIDALLGQNLCGADVAVALGKRIAGNMAQVATVMSIPLDGLMEKSLFTTREAATDDSWPTGGLLNASVDMTRPEKLPSGC